MINPQEIQDKTFVKAVFGGYDMASVDEFLEPLTADYIALYKEVATLKSKMKVLVETIEEYRREEESVKKALVIAQKSSDELMSETQKKCTQMVNAAEALAKSKTEAYRNEAYTEQEKLNRAKQVTQNYFERAKALLNQQLQQINDLAAMDVHAPAGGAPVSKAAFDVVEAEQEEKPAAETEVPADDNPDLGATRVIRVPASAIAEGGLYEEIVNQDVPAQAKAEPEPKTEPKPQAQRTSKFEFIDLQFGKDYDPKK